MSEGNKNQLMKIYDLLLQAYGYQGWWPLSTETESKGFDERGYHKKDYIHPQTEAHKLEICIGAILTQNTAWKNVEKALINLKKQNLMNAEKIIAADNKRLSAIIKPAGYYNIKSKKLKAFAKFFIVHKEKFNSSSIERESLLSMWGVGKETADSILLYALDKPFFVIDAYTKRIFSRIGFFDEKISYEKAQEFFHKNLANDYKLFNEYHALIVEHAKQHCAKKPKCRGCVLRNKCKYFKSLR